MARSRSRPRLRPGVRPPVRPGLGVQGGPCIARELAAQRCRRRCGADLRGQIHGLNERLNQAGLHPGQNLAARFEDLAQTVADALEAAAPRGPAAPSWIGLDRDTYHAQLADLRQWADTVLRQHYGGYELSECWSRHIHAVWELSTLAAEWHHTYTGTRPDLARALEFHDRWLPGTMRRITSITRGCMPQCAALRSTVDWTARPRYR
jgi:hypothetical protein